MFISILAACTCVLVSLLAAVVISAGFSESLRQGGAEAPSVVLMHCIWFNPLRDDHDECFVSGSKNLAYVLATVSASDIVAFL